MHCNGNYVYVFLFWELRGLSPNFHIYVSVSDIIFPGSVHIFPTAEKADPSWEYIIRSQTHECGNWDWDPDIPFLGIFVSNFRHFVFAVWHQASESASDVPTCVRCAAAARQIVCHTSGMKLSCGVTNIEDCTHQVYYVIRVLGYCLSRRGVRRSDEIASKPDAPCSLNLDATHVP